MKQPALYRLNRHELQGILDALLRRGYDVIGPALRNHAIILDSIRSIEDLPAGWSAETAPGRYRTKRRADNALFGAAVGPDSLKKYFHPSRVRLLRAQRTNGAFHILSEPRESPKRAFFGVRPCDLAAVARQDRILRDDQYTDDVYRANRAHVFIIAAQCTEGAETCFCESVGTGPRAEAGFDLALTERPVDNTTEFLVEVGSDEGLAVLNEVQPSKAPKAWLDESRDACRTYGAAQSRRLSLDQAAQIFDLSFDHPHWDNVADRCLACSNCTLACPTCFCVNTEDRSTVDGATAERWRLWDSCFTQQFTYIHGGTIRFSAKARYRQWISHKLGRWKEQFGAGGCVGCGRCIAWCPGAIDITREFAELKSAVAGGIK